jgi:chromosome segregation ATPase
VTAQTQKQQTRLESVREQLNNMEEQIAGLDSNKESLREVCDKLFRQLEQDHKRLESGLTQMNDMEELLLSCQEELNKAEQQVKTLEGQIDCL